jgi:hypothetical protein
MEEVYGFARLLLHFAESLDESNLRSRVHGVNEVKDDGDPVFQNIALHYSLVEGVELERFGPVLQNMKSVSTCEVTHICPRMCPRGDLSKKAPLELCQEYIPREAMNSPETLLTCSLTFWACSSVRTSAKSFL